MRPRYKERDRTPWKKFSDLSSVLYSDGLELGLFRRGERVGDLVKLSGDPRDDGAEAVTESDARDGASLFRSFFDWQPQAPHRPKALAEVLAPVCHLLREDVKEALAQTGSPLVALAEDWRQFFIADADDREFADAYAQTLTYALLLARFSGAGDLLRADVTHYLVLRKHVRPSQRRSGSVLGAVHAEISVSGYNSPAPRSTRS